MIAFGSRAPNPEPRLHRCDALGSARRKGNYNLASSFLIKPDSGIPKLVIASSIWPTTSRGKNSKRSAISRRVWSSARLARAIERCCRNSLVCRRAWPSAMFAGTLTAARRILICQPVFLERRQFADKFVDLWDEFHGSLPNPQILIALYFGAHCCSSSGPSPEPRAPSPSC